VQVSKLPEILEPSRNLQNVATVYGRAIDGMYMVICIIIEYACTCCQLTRC
jgi:hypothetical protein